MAKSYFKKALADVKNGADSRGAAWLYNEFSEFYQQNNMPDSSVYFAQKAVNLAPLEKRPIEYRAYRFIPT